MSAQPPSCGDLRGDLAQFLLGAPGEDDGGAQRRQFMGDAAADAAAAAGDPMHFAGEQAGAQHAGVALEKGALVVRRSLWTPPARAPVNAGSMARHRTHRCR